MKSLGISKDLCIEKTRMEALLNVARASGNTPIPYKKIGDVLQVNEDEVEHWIVKASGEKLLTARIDQIQRLVSVMTCNSRGFDGTIVFANSV